MTIFENIAFGSASMENLPGEYAARSRHDGARKGRALERGEGQGSNASGLSLSGGPQQRLCMRAQHRERTRKSSSSTKPCSALDPISTARVEELIEELRSDYKSRS